MDLDGVVAASRRWERRAGKRVRGGDASEEDVRDGGESKMREKEKKQQPGQEEYNKSTNTKEEKN